MSGIAAGTVNAAILSSFPIGSEKEAVAKMEQFWTDASATPLYKDWLGGITEGFLMKGGLYNSSPL